MKTLLQGGSIVTASGVTRADLLIDGEKIAAIGTGLCADGAQTVDVSGRLLFLPKNSIGIQYKSKFNIF